MVGAEMSDESEKRFHSVMNRLFHAPKSPSRSSSERALNGKKRSNPSSGLALVAPRSSGNLAAASTSEASICRPWDRGDLMRRSATFKSMTWFAKPERISAINCARRGWINTDIDMISCEACGAQFVFSTPSSWNQEQVEKAASVFSVKLEKGHKSLCPWIDNVCDEILSQFPPMPPIALVDKFKERQSSLSQLVALPVISSSAIEHVKCPQFEQVFDKASMDPARIEYLDNDRDLDSEKKYYQALTLISLCGWESHVLPYIVDINQTVIMTNSHNKAANKQITSINENLPEEIRVQSDPNSTALDCTLCGASVGLWAFSTVSRPMEFVRLIGYSETDDSRDNATSSNERRSDFTMTIAGGPPPAKQNFKAAISLPVVAQNLRARFCCDSEFGDRAVLDENESQVSSSEVENVVTAVQDTNTDQCASGSIALAEKDLKQKSSDETLKFDPIRQHRHFCPWIASTGNEAPGWKQTLLALHRQRGFSPLSHNSPSTSIIQVDDPLSSVRKLFMSPSPKRTKRDLSVKQK